MSVKLPFTCLDCGFHFNSRLEFPRCPQCRGRDVIDREACDYPSETPEPPFDTLEEARGQW